MKKANMMYIIQSEETFCDYYSPRRKRQGGGAKCSFKEIMVNNFPNLGTDLDIHFRKLIGLQTNLV